ncbi:MAG TPA: hypothetical protein P5055_21575 [Candidatus Paceibacterota bacterium]|nr:hypothetical protein [Candidatus Paceibacterota bacterium]
MYLRSLMAVLAAALLVVGCGGGEKSVSVDDAAAGAQKAFAAAGAEVKGAIDKAVTAYRANDFVGAVVMLQSVQDAPNLTADQTKAIDDLTRAVYEKLAALVEKGDPKAQQALGQLRNMRR